MIFDDCTIYDNCEPAGVELPKTNIPDKVLKELGLTKKKLQNRCIYRTVRKSNHRKRNR